VADPPLEYLIAEQGEKLKAEVAPLTAFSPSVIFADARLTAMMWI
jgi:hypothetical protein